MNILLICLFLLLSTSNVAIKKSSPAKKFKISTTPLLPPKHIPNGKQQQAYVKYLNDPNVKIVLGVGSAGVGKTLFACDSAIKLLYQGDQNINKIILTRPMVSVQSENMGFLPGDLNAKMNPWLLPIFDIFLEYFTQKEINKKITDGIIEICPLGFMRGRTFKNCFIIADEIQNATPTQVLMLATRIGSDTKLVITGDLDQSDLNGENGLQDLINKIKKNEGKGTLDEIKLVEFDYNDVKRSEVVKKILQIYAK